MLYTRTHITWHIVVPVLVALLFVPAVSWAHHGWGWATDREFEITGTIEEASLGNPHGEVVIRVDGERWVVQVGQPWRNSNAGLSESVLAQGRSMTVHGHRSAREGEKLVKAERVVIDGENYVLYPNRES